MILLHRATKRVIPRRRPCTVAIYEKKKGEINERKREDSKFILKPGEMNVNYECDSTSGCFFSEGVPHYVHFARVCLLDTITRQRCSGSSKSKLTN